MNTQYIKVFMEIEQEVVLRKTVYKGEDITTASKLIPSMIHESLN